MAGIDSLEESALRKVRVRLLPFLFVLYIAAWTDRVNVGFAALQMNDALRFSATAFGFGSGVFFLGYCLFEVPSNFILHRVGARRWIARIMISWGIIAAAMMFVKTPLQFYMLRFLLGVAEAGFFPGVIYYMSYWFPRQHRARAVGAFMMAIPVAGLIGGPLSGALLGLDGLMGLGGWQWLFLIEGLPSVLLGFWAWHYLTDRPEDARWLPEEEKAALIARLAMEQQEIQGSHARSALASLRNPAVWHLGSIFFLANMGFYAYTIWSPQLIKSFVGTDDLMVGAISGAISTVVIAIMLLNCAHSDRTGERPLHVAIPLGIVALGFAGCALLGNSPLSIVVLALVPIGMGAAYGPFWSIPSSFLVGEAAAAGIAMVATIVNASGFVGPTLVGALKGQTGEYTTGLLVLAAAAGLAALVTVPLRRSRRQLHPLRSRAL
ncbi:MAG TPA: MFS transporter [Steroidobacteraceae bacterium]|jgi:ACS family tartrate transporter-like MFS transporter